MSVSIGYDHDSRMVISGLECKCGLAHNEPKQDIYVGEDIIRNVPKYIRKRGMGEKCVLVCDRNTYEAAGRSVEEYLKADGFSVTLCMLVREGKVVPDERAVGEVIMALSRDTEFLVAVGSGSVTDVTRVSAVNAHLPFVSVGTAPSMDGYTSIVAPLIYRGAKVHRSANCPDVIVCDLTVMSKAPEKMFVSGVGDVLGKYIAKADWVLGSIINGETYCTASGEIVIEAVDRLLNNIPEIKKRTILGTRILIEALLLAGLTIMIIGHTRAVASIEHNIVHYWDMSMLKKGKSEPTHGTAVGISTYLIWPIFEAVAKDGFVKVDKEIVKNNRLSREAREKWVLGTYGDENGREIIRENPGDFLTWEEQERRIDRAFMCEEEIKKELSLLPDRKRIEDAMRLLGSEMTPGEIGIDKKTLNVSLRCAKDYRERYSLFKLLDEMGVLEKYLTMIK
ncbi:MAG: sn-glycerol-1-phosphate dehydrogenase [Clostridia bacterium]|nr:sn-glycerol-1-phosphate dehydrogenase [Clostridia bacterium]